MSQATAAAFLLKPMKTSSRSLWSFDLACVKSFTDIPSFYAEASNTISVLVVFYLFLQLGNVQGNCLLL